MLFSKPMVVAWAIVLTPFGQSAHAGWAFTQQPAEERAHACQEQVSFCYNACESVALTRVNFCNIRTMGWNCACADKADNAKVRHYEWPIAVAECRAALNMCNTGCASHTNGNEQAACYTSCTVDYACNTATAPISALHVQAAEEKPAGYIQPLDDKDIELTIGMKFDSDADSNQSQSGDLGSLPKIIPRDGNASAADSSDGGKGKSNGASRSNASNGRNQAGSGGRIVSASSPGQYEQQVPVMVGALLQLLLMSAFFGVGGL
ncbi:hypothetical protein COEREDRAFT_86971 [Coemansia reversa NRRL 1564]|uniref:DUF7707 domain-containing protein n=1 Tax=Coemansia reversa (strain ATCC 12441 / NRRL 1564) TaxID=763665 RepID=A0A2G5BC42_COERN|nr:hypothetical protein COEREDRAFT_86971 [Coemansia reversa NRRL 1564]|eukprot:PIA16589.1 hypothetical protein COEREDRAFT_86971 [Coemansia reversa NRRL 1564]